MSCIHVHEKATTEQHVHSLLPWPWPAAGVRVDVIELNHGCLLTGFFFQFLSLRLTLFVLLSTSVAAHVMVYVHDSVKWKQLCSTGASFSIQNGLVVKANTFQKEAIFLIGEQFISGLSDREARKLEESSSWSANARAMPGWPASICIKYKQLILVFEPTVRSSRKSNLPNLRAIGQDLLWKKTGVIGSMYVDSLLAWSKLFAARRWSDISPGALQEKKKSILCKNTEKQPLLEHVLLKMIMNWSSSKNVKNTEIERSDCFFFHRFSAGFCVSWRKFVDFDAGWTFSTSFTLKFRLES